METFNFFELLSVYTQDKNSDYSTEEIDEAILFSIMKAQKRYLENIKDNMDNSEKTKNAEKLEEIQREVKKAQLKMAITWDRSDIARKFIMEIDNQIWETKYMHEFMYLAIKQNKIEFVRLFLENGFVLSKFLTYRCLIKLYNDVSVKYFCRSKFKIKFF